MSTANETVPTVSSGTVAEREAVNESHNATTKFADDTIGYVGEVEDLVYSDKYSTHITANSSQTIVDFLMRPSIITSGSFTTSDTGILYIADITSLITANKANRMSNIYTYRADFELTLQVNADRFQQGRYILFWLPTAGVESPSLTYSLTNSVALWRNMHTVNLTKITQLPHVEIDLATQTHVTLRVPYSSILPMLSWSTNTSSSLQGMGPFGIIPYSPLNPGSGGSSTCGYTLFGSLQNIKIGAASVNQSLVSTSEAKAQKVGPVTTIFSKVAKTSDVWGDVPMIGSFARNVSWMARLVAKSATIWGFSKPLAVAAPTRMDRKTVPFAAVGDVASYAKPLGLMAENSVSVPSLLPVGADEMDYSHIVRHYAFLSSFTWATADSAGAVVASINVTPQGSVNFSKGVQHTPLSFVYNQFFRWRGSINYRFKVVKTSFHRGRLAIAYYPGVSGTTGNLATSEFVFREIVDLSVTSTFEVCCPYMLPQPWANNGSQMGVLQIYVLDPLVAPTTVSTSVTLLMEVAGGPDMQFSAPIVWQVEPYAPSTAQSGEEPYTETPCFVLGPKNSGMLDNLNAETSGEVARSLRATLKRNWHYGKTSLPIGAGAAIQLYPYAVTPVTQGPTTAGTLFRDVYKSDYINLWSCAFAYSYGSLEYIFAPPGGTTPSGTQQQYTLETRALAGLSTLTASFYSGAYSLTGFCTYSTLGIEGSAEIRAPNWNNGIGRSVCAQFCNVGSSTPMVEPQANCTNIQIGDSQTVALYYVGVARHAGDDFGLGMFVGVPPVVTYTAS